KWWTTKLRIWSRLWRHPDTSRPPRNPGGGAMTLHVTIIGGGASGTLAAAHLLQRRGTPQRLRITIVEAREDVGCGIAYSTDQSSHLVSTRSNNMSACAEVPGHFSRWLERRDPATARDLEFVPRKTYGRYLADLIAPDCASASIPRLQILQNECVSLRV